MATAFSLWKEINDSMTEKERRKYDIDGDGEISVVEFLKVVNYAECQYSSAVLGREHESTLLTDSGLATALQNLGQVCRGGSHAAWHAGHAAARTRRRAHQVNTLETATNLALLPSRHRRQSVKLQMNADAHAGHYRRRLHDYSSQRPWPRRLLGFCCVCADSFHVPIAPKLNGRPCCCYVLFMPRCVDRVCRHR